MKNIKYFWLLSALIAVLIVISCADEKTSPEPVRPVRYMQVKASRGSQELTFSGVAQAGLESKLSFRVPGTVQSVEVVVGSNVSSGQLIARLDPKDYQLQVQEAQASLDQAKAQATNADNNYSRVRQLYENNTASKNQLDQARAAAESAEALVESISKRLELAQRKLGYTQLTAPVKGAIAAVNAEVNENVSSGQPVALLTSGARPEVKVAIPENLITQIKVGSCVVVTFDALPEHSFQAKVTEVGVSTTGVATTFPVTVMLDEEEKNIRPGMTAEVAFRFEAENEQERLFVPLKAVNADQQGQFVYLIEPEDSGLGIIRRRTVEKGELSADGLEIIEGLSEGDLLVTAGMSKIREGLKVKLLEEMEERR